MLSDLLILVKSVGYEAVSLLFNVIIPSLLVGWASSALQVSDYIIEVCFLGAMGSLSLVTI